MLYSISLKNHLEIAADALDKARVNFEILTRIGESIYRLAQGCPKHPNYRAKKVPTIKCKTCKELYALSINVQLWR